jgi:hypothetical protein
MTPKEKAKELIQKAYDLNQHNKTSQSRCKQIALLCVDKIIKTKPLKKDYEDHGYKGREVWYYDTYEDIADRIGISIERVRAICGVRSK